MAHFSDKDKLYLTQQMVLSRKGRDIEYKGEMVEIVDFVNGKVLMRKGCGSRVCCSPEVVGLVPNID